VTTSWRPDPLGNGVKYLDVVDQIRNAIRSGALRPGERLPTHRAFARDAGVAISTITQAYAEAARLHFVAGQVGRGTFVLADSADAALFAATAGHQYADGIIDLSANSPAVDPGSDDLQVALAALSTTHRVDEGYPSAASLLRGRLAMEHLLAARGIAMTERDLVLTAGAQHGLFAALLSLAGPGSRVLAEELTFPGLKAAARQLRIELIPVRLDGEGLLPDDLARQALRSSASVLVCVPTLQNPTGSCMSEQRRLDLAHVIRRNGITVIEDDVYGPLQDSPCLASAVAERTVVLTSVSKTIEPSLRIGALAGPSELMTPIASEVQLTSWSVSTASIEVLSRWTLDGTAKRRTTWQRKEIRERWRIADQLLGRSDHAPAPHRYVAVDRSPDRIAAACQEAGVLVVPSSVLGIGPKPPKGIRISLAAPRSRATLHAALKIIQPITSAGSLGVQAS
jgi:DNA-binding transcriptional MocR family regulator